MGIAENLARIQAQVADACARARRSPDEVRLMAVSKTRPAEAILEAYAAGQRLFGENRVQEAEAKRAPLAALAALELHLIGPLQSNKTSRAAELFHAIDTVDSRRTAERLSSAAAALGRTLEVLVEVKLSDEPSKHGVAPAALAALLAEIGALPNLEVRGLMTVPAASDDPEAARPAFAALRRLRDGLRARYPRLSELSMGMSHDFGVAIEEGATTVRIGTALFGRRP